MSQLPQQSHAPSSRARLPLRFRDLRADKAPVGVEAGEPRAAAPDDIAIANRAAQARILSRCLQNVRNQLIRDSFAGNLERPQKFRQQKEKLRSQDAAQIRSRARPASWRGIGRSLKQCRLASGFRGASAAYI